MSKNLPHILITNDDGIHAAGIKELWRVLKPYAHLTVVAPATEQSAVGLSTTLRSPLRIEKIYWEGGENRIWSVTGTPADCVKMALNVIVDKKPDLVVAGINRGTNMGQSVLYSGTVAATIESIMQKIPAIAFSCHEFIVEPDYQTAGKHIPNIVQYVLEHPLPYGTLLNVNFPERSAGEIKGFKMTTQGKDWWGENPDKRTHPDEGHTYYWLGGKLRQSEDSTEEGDGAWLRRGYVTAVPVHVRDLTDYKHLMEKREIFERCFGA